MDSWGLKLIVVWRKEAAPAVLRLTAFADNEKHAKQRARELVKKVNEKAIVKDYLTIQQITVERKEKEEK